MTHYLVHYIIFDVTKDCSMLPFTLCDSAYVKYGKYREFASFPDVGVVIYRYIDKTRNDLMVAVNANGKSYSYRCPYSHHAHRVIKAARQRISFPVLPYNGWEDFISHKCNPDKLLPVLPLTTAQAVRDGDGYLCGVLVGNLFSHEALFLMNTITSFVVILKTKSRKVYYYVNPYDCLYNTPVLTRKGYHIRLNFVSPNIIGKDDFIIGSHVQ